MAIRLHQTEPASRRALPHSSRRSVRFPSRSTTSSELLSRLCAPGATPPSSTIPKVRRCDLETLGIAVSRDDIAARLCRGRRRGGRRADVARDRIAAHHQRQKPADDRYVDPIGVELGSRWTAIEAVGLYVPGGTASYPSSVLMMTVPAKVAGVDRVVITVPAPRARSIRWCWSRRSRGRFGNLRVGGAQAIAALAYGTQTIRPVAKIVGPAMPLSRRPSGKCSAPSAST